MLKDSKYSPDKVNCICVKKGDVVNLPDNLAAAWVANKTCEEVRKKISNPVQEKKIVNPVEEVKAPKPKTKKNK